MSRILGDQIMMGGNSILLKAEDEVKKKKKDGLGEVLKLMQGMKDLQEQIELTIEAQENPEMRSKIEAFDNHVDDMLSALLTIAEEGIRGIRKRNVDGITPSDDLGPAPAPSVPSNPLPETPSVLSSSPITVKSPRSPVAPR